MAVSKRLRFEILRRDNHACRYCGAKAPETPLTVDHVVPEALGGSDDPSNLVAACGPCNSGKSSIPADAAVVADVQNDAIRWARALQSAIEIGRAKRSSDKEFVSTVMNTAAGLSAGFFTQVDGDYPRTIIQFRDLGLDLDDIADAINRTRARGLFGLNRWKYFCGICWGIIRDRQEIARSLLATGEVE